VDSKTRNRVLKIALSWINTPWHHQARLKGVGVDCAQYLCAVYYEAGLIPHVDPRPYPRDWHFHRDDERFLRWLRLYADQVDKPVKGDVAVFKFGRTFSHGSIIIKWPLVVHAYLDDFVREQDATQGFLANRDVLFFRVRQAV
jgi:cell wall-associated NlpC family hydrolase